MDDVNAKAARCFTRVFPDLKAEDVSRASTASMAAWDSVAQVTLLSTISEEFGVEFEMEDFEQLVSYPLIVDHLESKLGHG